MHPDAAVADPDRHCRLCRCSCIGSCGARCAGRVDGCAPLLPCAGARTARQPLSSRLHPRRTRTRTWRDARKRTGARWLPSIAALLAVAVADVDAGNSMKKPDWSQVAGQALLLIFVHFCTSMHNVH
jgi:hypothetical protein